jgi:hypothetical protein
MGPVFHQFKPLQWPPQPASKSVLACRRAAAMATATVDAPGAFTKPEEVFARFAAKGRVGPGWQQCSRPRGRTPLFSRKSRALPRHLADRLQRSPRPVVAGLAKARAARSPHGPATAGNFWAAYAAADRGWCQLRCRADRSGRAQTPRAVPKASQWMRGDARQALGTERPTLFPSCTSICLTVAAFASGLLHQATGVITDFRAANAVLG